jgi:signal transduction histidine kinase
MTERNNKLDEISHEFSENILAVKGTLELMDTSVTEDDMHDLLLKAMQRMDNIQKLSNDMLDA